MTKIYTTLNCIREHQPCHAGWAKLLRYLGKTQADDEPVSLLTVLDSNGVDDALWCLRAIDGHEREMRLYAAWCARQVQHLMTDPCSLTALDVAERHANGVATDAELAAASKAAWAAALTLSGAATEHAAYRAAWAAASAAAGASWAAAPEAARDAVAASEAAPEAARSAQTAEFRRVFCSEDCAQRHAQGEKQ